jgi:hypothetical protein
MTRSRRAGLSRAETLQQPLYARLLGLQYLAPGGFLCFVFLEGAVALGLLLALAELVSWWGVVVLPMVVAAMVKLNDVVAGALIRPASVGRIASPGGQTVRLSSAMISQAGGVPRSAGGSPMLRPASARRVAGDAMGGGRGEERWISGGTDASALNGPPVTRKWTEDLDDQQQRARQSAARRYE